MEGTKSKQEIYSAAVQKLVYTQLTGIYYGFIYIRTAQLWPCLLTHSIVNWFGFPQFHNLRDEKIDAKLRLATYYLYIGGPILSLSLFEKLLPQQDAWFTRTIEIENIPLYTLIRNIDLV